MRFRGGFQDAEGILTTQMLVAAIILSIVVTLHTGSFSHDALVAGDIRHAAFDEARGKELEEDSYERFISGRLFVDGYISVSSSAYSLLSAAAIYISLIFSGSRSDSALFQRWWRFGRVCILLSYVTLLVSIFYFLRLEHDSVYMVYPKYNWNAVLNVSDVADSVQRRLGAARAAAGSGTSGSGASGTSGSFQASGDGRHYGYDVGVMSKNFKLGMNIALGLTAFMLAVGHTWISCFQGRSSDAQNDAEVDESCSEVAPEATSAVDFLAEQSKLLKEQNELLVQFLQQRQHSDRMTGAKSSGIISGSWPVEPVMSKEGAEAVQGVPISGSEASISSTMQELEPSMWQRTASCV
jgi:hypothetical protein